MALKFITHNLVNTIAGKIKTVGIVYVTVVTCLKCTARGNIVLCIAKYSISGAPITP